MGYLRITLELSVHIEIKRRVNTFKVDVVLFARLLFQIEGAAVMPTRILIRKVRKHNRERISRIQVLNVVISVHLNTRRPRAALGDDYEPRDENATEGHCRGCYGVRRDILGAYG